MTEAPFVSRERLRKYQEHFQGVSKHTFLKGRYDKLTSVAIPIALAVSSLALIVSLNLSFPFVSLKILLKTVHCAGARHLQHVPWDWEEDMSFVRDL